jgi:hypothetical protein
MDQKITGFMDELLIYGKLAGTGILLYLVSKKIFNWIILPLLLVVSLKQLALLTGDIRYEQINPSHAICSWIFLTVILKRVFYFFFEKRSNTTK